LETSLAPWQATANWPGSTFTLHLGAAVT